MLNLKFVKGPREYTPDILMIILISTKINVTT